MWRRVGPIPACSEKKWFFVCFSILLILFLGYPGIFLFFNYSRLNLFKNLLSTGVILATRSFTESIYFSLKFKANKYKLMGLFQFHDENYHQQQFQNDDVIQSYMKPKRAQRLLEEGAGICL